MSTKSQKKHSHGRNNQEGIKTGDHPARRLARVAVGVLVILAVTTAGVIFLTPEPQSAVMAIVDNCPDPPPEPGPARPWESEIAVSTYSTVNTRTRNLFTAIPIVSWSGRGPDMNMVLYHNAANVGLPPSRSDNVGFDLGPGWSIAYSDQLLFDDPANPTQITVVQDNGTENVFTWDAVAMEWVPPAGVYDKLTFSFDGGDTWTVTHKDQSRHVFRRQNVSLPDDGIFRLAGVFDAAGNATTITYEQIGTSPKFRIQKITAAGRYLLFAYDPTNGKLLTITDPSELGEGVILPTRSWSFVYETSGSGRLERLEDAMGFLNRFAYDADSRLSEVSDKTDDVTAILPLGESYRFTYFADGGVSMVTDPDDITDPNDGLTQSFSTGCERIWLSPGVSIGTIAHYSSYYDRRGNRVDYVYNGAFPVQRPDGNLTKVKTYMAQTAVASRFEYDSDRNLVSAYDEINHGWTATYDDRGNMLTRSTRVTGLQGWFYRWQYDSYNNVTQYTDPANNTTTFLYEDPNYPTLLTKIIEPPDGQGNPAAETVMSYDTTGQLSEVIDPNGVITRFEYDAFGQPGAYAEGQHNDGSDVYWEALKHDGGSRLLGNKGSALAGPGVVCPQFENCEGPNVCSSIEYNANGGMTSSSCPLMALSGGGSGGASVANVGPPRNATTLQEISASLDDAMYTPKGELTSASFGVSITRGTSQSIFVRDRTYAYDNLGRKTEATIATDESGTGVITGFTYAYTNQGGTVTRTGPDGVDTVVTLDAKSRVDYMRRGPAGASLAEARYDYYDNDLLLRVTQFNADGATVNGSVEYDYYDNNLVHNIRHLNGFGLVVKRYEYVYADIGAPASITEYDSGGAAEFVTSFTYDNRGRLIEEKRVEAVLGGYAYWYAYEYDAGGNRKMKLDHANNREWKYTYDLDEPAAYDTANNRLMMVEEFTGQGDFAALSKTTWYFYNCAGNVTWIISHDESAGGSVSSGLGGEGIASNAQVPAGGCPTYFLKYTSTRFGYATNGRTVTHALGEEWCGSSGGGILDYKVTWAHQFRYDGARQRYLDIELDPADLTRHIDTAVARTWTDYDGDQPYRSTYSTPDTGAFAEAGYELGLARIATMGGATITSYYHTDMLGTTRFMTDANGVMSEQAVYTAFGERVSGGPNRFGYVGAFGYQSASSDTPGDPYVSGMTYQHVGARYYDPTTGRFLQRDPIGIRGGKNVYAYVRNGPTVGADPEGEFILIAIVSGIAAGVKAATAYYNYRAAQDAADAARPYNDGSNESTQRHLESRKDALRRSAKHIQGVMSCVPGTSLTGPPQPSTDAAGGALEAVGGFGGG